MSETAQLNGELFIKMVKGGAENLRKNASVVNDLNVFPIPDGDTGENMSLTICGGLDSIGDCSGLPLSEVSKRLADGMLLSARGNSGVILSQLFAGLASGFSAAKTADPAEIADALRCGVKCAYDAVAVPTEGTILTVAREAAEYVCGRVSETSTVETLAADYLKEMNASLKRTPELLPVLKEAGVIDSGGAGLVYITDGMNRVLNGEEPTAGDALAPAQPNTAVDVSRFDENCVLEFGYCTEFLMRLQSSKIDIKSFKISKLIEWLETIGNSVVAFQNDTIVKVHVHTMTPGRVLDHCQKYGEFLTLKIENMMLQHNESVVENRFPDQEKKHKPLGIVAAASGSGIRELFLSLGADAVIDENSSSKDFIDAFDDVCADVIFVLPNNKNLIMVARQAAELYEGSDVRVLESRDIGDGYAAMSMLCLDSGDADEIQAELAGAMVGVVTGQVSRSVRDAVINGVEIREGAYIGFTEKEMLTARDDKLTAAVSLLEALEAGKSEILIAVYGTDVTEEEKEAFRAEKRSRFPKPELCELDGGQDKYDFLLILE